MDKPPGRADRFLKPHSLGDPSACAAWRLPADMRSACPSRNGCMGFCEVSADMGMCMCAGDGMAAAREARGGAGRLPDAYLEKYEGPEWRIWAAPARGPGRGWGPPARAANVLRCDLARAGLRSPPPGAQGSSMSRAGRTALPAWRCGW